MGASDHHASTGRAMTQRLSRTKKWELSRQALALAATFALVPSAHAQTPPPASSQSAQSPDEEEAVVVTGVRRPGSVPGDAVPQIVLSPEEIRSYGASNLDELLTSLAPELGSARG